MEERECKQHAAVHTEVVVTDAVLLKARKREERWGGGGRGDGRERVQAACSSAYRGGSH